VTEKAMVLAGLEKRQSNASLARCKSPKAVFLVDVHANKQAIARAIEELYREKKVRVVKVNTIRVKAKPRRVRGRAGFKSAFKKAIVTFESGDSIEET
jgi:large subunit ribosomal protein L23